MASLEEVLHLLQATLSPEANTRRGAEEALKARYSTPGFVVLLFQACIIQQAPEQIRQAASIMFKNIVQYYWSHTAPQEGDDLTRHVWFQPNDKAVIRDNYLNALQNASPLVRAQLIVALRGPVREDYPDNWGSLLQNAIPMVTGGNPEQAHIGLLVLFVVVRKYQFHSTSERQVLDQIVQNAFPILFQIISKTIQSADMISCQITKVIIKTFWAAIQHVPSPYLKEPQVFASWFDMFIRFLQSPGPASNPNMDDRENGQHPHWKAKKWTANICIRYMSKHGNKKLCNEDERPFAKYFMDTYACPLAQSFVQILQNWRAGQYVPNRLLQQCIDFLEPCIDYAQVYKFLKPGLDFIMNDVIFRLMCFSEEDANTWQEDPHEYVRKSFDLMEQYYDPKTAAVNFLLQLVKVRGKDMLDRFMGIVHQNLQAFAQNPSDLARSRAMDGALHSIGVLHKKLRKNKTYSGFIEQMLMTHVFPLLNSTAGFLRARAVWVYGQYSTIEFKNMEHFASMFRTSLELLRDPELPVRIQAAITIRNCVSNVEGAVEVIRPILTQILDSFFGIAQEAGTEDMIMVISNLIEKLRDDIAPYATQLTTKLMEFYLQYAEADKNDNDDDGTAAMAAYESFRALNTVLEAVLHIPEVYMQIEPLVIPFLANILNGDCGDILEEVMQTLASMTYHAPSITPAMWSMYPIVCRLSHEFSDFFDVLLVPLDNFISRDQQTFLSGDNLSMVLTVCQKMISDVYAGEEAARNACKLIESILHNCRGRVDPIIQPVVVLAMQRLQSEIQTNSLRTLLLEVICNCLFYNAALTLSVFESTQTTQTILTAIIQQESHYKRLYDKKIVFIGLCSILGVPAAALPVSVAQSLNVVFDFLLALLQNIHLQRARQNEEGSEGDDEEDYDSDEEDLDINDEDDAVGDIESDQLQRLAKKAAIAGDLDDFDDEDLEEEEDFSTPIDDVDEFIMLGTLVGAAPTSAESALHLLAQDRKEKFAAILFQSNVRAGEIEKERAANAK